MNASEIKQSNPAQMARRLATAKVSQSRVSLGGGQAESLVTQLSAEALQRVDGDSGRPDAILSGLNSFFMSVNLQESSPKKKVTKRKIVWAPTAKVGEVKKGLSVMGRLKIIDEVEDESAGGFVSISYSQSGQGASLNISMGSANGNSGSRVEGGEALHNLMKNGLVADGLQALLDGDKNGSNQSGSRSLTVRTNGTGRQKVLSLTRGGLLGDNVSTLGAFQVLDGNPILKKPMDPSSIYRGFSGRKVS
ncbi:MAG: hypothetical protein KC800_28110 [Candidatus Eremiobacteraeota bacterium]|nr:hypothetical protein [Candidatus Eremiobacteraeota bacterium]